MLASSNKFSLLKGMRVRNKILLGFLLISLVFIVGMLADYNSAQNLTNLNNKIVNKDSAIKTQADELSLEYEIQSTLYKSYTAGAYIGAKSKFTANEVIIDDNITTLESLVNGSTIEQTVKQLDNNGDIFTNTVENGVMFYPTEVQTSTIISGIEAFKSDVLNMYQNIVDFQLTNDTSYLSKYQGFIQDLTSKNATIISTIGQIKSININLFNELNNAYTGLLTDYNTLFSTVFNPATNTINGTQWAIANKGSTNRVQNDLNYFVQTIPVFSNLENDTLIKADANLQVVLKDLTAIKDFSLSEMANARVQSISASNLVTETTLAVIILGIILALIIAFTISTNISKPLTNLSDNTKVIASGDLTLQITDSDQQISDEVGQLKTHFNQMVNYLKDTVKQIDSVAGSLNTSAQELAASSEEVNSSSEEISAISQQIAKGSVEQVTQIQETVLISQDLKKDFEEKIRNIDQMSNLIENISNQVNMLALNASIEAARAGEYGRGFSVVADNVRKLADESKDSVAKVKVIITSLGTTIANSIERLSGAIEKIASIAEDTSTGAEESSAATEEQAATMQEMTASAQEIAHIASQLEAAIQKFKIK